MSLTNSHSQPGKIPKRIIWQKPFYLKKEEEIKNLDLTQLLDKFISSLEVIGFKNVTFFENSELSFYLNICVKCIVKFYFEEYHRFESIYKEMTSERLFSNIISFKDIILGRYENALGRKKCLWVNKLDELIDYFGDIAQDNQRYLFPSLLMAKVVFNISFYSGSKSKRHKIVMDEIGQYAEFAKMIQEYISRGFNYPIPQGGTFRMASLEKKVNDLEKRVSDWEGKYECKDQPNNNSK